MMASWQSWHRWQSLNPESTVTTEPRSARTAPSPTISRGAASGAATPASRETPTEQQQRSLSGVFEPCPLKPGSEHHWTLIDRLTVESTTLPATVPPPRTEHRSLEAPVVVLEEFLELARRLGLLLETEGAVLPVRPVRHLQQVGHHLARKVEGVPLARRDLVEERGLCAGHRVDDVVLEVFLVAPVLVVFEWDVALVAARNNVITNLVLQIRRDWNDLQMTVDLPRLGGGVSFVHDTCLSELFPEALLQRLLILLDLLPHVVGHLAGAAVVRDGEDEDVLRH
mmetsp:Transcript_42011/g.105064  ORF Transcript_42011/g.105064 Transcript_42011/m.105064 type:complete len:283 (+) Transcript_42011:107-955(+)